MQTSPKKTCATEDSNAGVSTNKNKIYFYSEVTSQSLLELRKQILALVDVQKIDNIVKGTPFYPIEVHIQSNGGELSPALAMVDFMSITSNTVPIYTYCEGVVASAATFLAICGKQRFITENSIMLIHQLFGITWGKYSEIVDDFKNSTMLMNIMKKMYTKYTRLPKEKLENLLSSDLYLSAKTCVRYKIADKII